MNEQDLKAFDKWCQDERYHFFESTSHEQEIIISRSAWLAKEIV